MAKPRAHCADLAKHAFVCAAALSMIDFACVQHQQGSAPTSISEETCSGIDVVGISKSLYVFEYVYVSSMCMCRLWHAAAVYSCK